MVFYVFLALFLPCAVTSIVFIVYFCSLWYVATYQARNEHQVVKNSKRRGLSATQLEKLPRITGKDLALQNECAVCLEDIESEEPVRLLPNCNHGFHIECADVWLTKHPECPLCRAKLDLDELFDPPETNPC